MKRSKSASQEKYDTGFVEASEPTGSSASQTKRDGEKLFGRKPPRRDRPPKFYRIGEIVDYTGVSRQTIHNYTTMGLIFESDWTRGGHRLYDENVFERLDTIAFLRNQRKSLDFIKKYFVQLDSGKDA